MRRGPHRRGGSLQPAQLARRLVELGAHRVGAPLLGPPRLGRRHELLLALAAQLRQGVLVVSLDLPSLAEGLLPQQRESLLVLPPHALRLLVEVAPLRHQRLVGRILHLHPVQRVC